MDKVKKEPKILKEQYSSKFLSELEEIYPKIGITKIAKALRHKICPKCGRKLHKLIDGEKGDYYCVCESELIIKF